MSHVVSKSSTVCATCERWLGARRADEWSQIQLEDPNATGECRGGLYHTQQMLQSATCPQWQVWAPLK